MSQRARSLINRTKTPNDQQRRKLHFESGNSSALPALSVKKSQAFFKKAGSGWSIRGGNKPEEIYLGEDLHCELDLHTWALSLQACGRGRGQSMAPTKEGNGDPFEPLWMLARQVKRHQHTKSEHSTDQRTQNDLHLRRLGCTHRRVCNCLGL